MGFADVVCVNSGFTKGVVSKQWPGLADRKELEVVYPCVDGREKKVEEEGNEVLMWRDRDILLSINRFEKKKDIALAIRAYAGLGKHGRKGVRLVVAGKTPLLTYVLWEIWLDKYLFQMLMQSSRWL